jgi:hypothetical protein
MFKLSQPMPKLTGSKYDAFKKTMKAAKDKAVKEDLASIRRTISNPLPSEGPKPSLGSFVPGQTPSSKGGRYKRRRSRKKRRKRKTKRKKSRKKRRKSRRKRRR